MTDGAGALAIIPEPLAWEEVKALVVDSVSSPHSKGAYARALEEFAEWATDEETAGRGSAAFAKALVQCWRSSLEQKRPRAFLDQRPAHGDQKARHRSRR